MPMKADHEARLVAKSDARFLAKLTGSPWCLKTGARSSSNSPVSGGGSRDSAAACGSHAAAAAAAATADTSHTAGPRLGSKSNAGLLTSAAADVCRASQHTGCLSASESHATPHQPPACAAGPRSRTAAGDAHASQEHRPSTAAGSLQATQTQSREQQCQPAALTQSRKVAQDSPQWLLHTAQHELDPASHVVSTQAHVQDSMYATWAHSQGCDSPTTPASHQAAALLSRSQAASPVPIAAAALGHSGGKFPDRSPSASPAAQAGRGRTGRSRSPLRQPSPMTGPEAATCLAADAAAVFPGSPSGSNYHSTRAAGLAAGISRAGAVSPEHQEWYMQQHPFAQPPRREDTQQLWQWLDEELQQLKQQWQQPREVQQLDQDRQLQASTNAAAAQPSSTKDCCSMSNGPAAASPSATVAAGSSGRSHSPGLTTRARSPARMQGAGGTASAAEGTGSMRTSLEQQAQQLTQLSRGGDSLLQPQQLQLQRDLYSAAFQELCRQVAVGCVERGALMAQLWSAHNVLLEAVLQDRQAAQQQCVAGQATAAALHEQQLMQQRQQDEKVALRAINERHAAKAEACKQEYDKLKQQHDNLQELLKRLSGAQQLVQRVMDLEASQQQQALDAQQLQAQVSTKQRELETTSAQLMHWQGRAQVAEARAQQQAQQLGCSTPRPKRDLGLLCDLVDPLQQQLIEQALVGGVPAEQVHRLLLGLSPSGTDMRPWLEVAGSCVPALQRAADPAQLLQLLRQHLADCDAASLAKHLSRPGHLQLLSQAVHVGTDTDTLLQLLTGSLGVGPHASPATTAAAVAAAATRCGHLAQPLSSFASPAAASAGAAAAPAAAAAAAGVGEGLPLLPLLGVLASKYGHDARELGGPVTDALQQAQLSTVARVQDLEARCRALHREVIMLKCTLAEQRKHEQERVEAALRDEKRKIARREARQPTSLEKLLQTKWGAVFDGIGLSEELPRVLRANVPINNKHMPKREAEKLASEIWAFKDEHDGAGDKPISLPEAAALFLERRYFAIPRLVTEVAYNLLYSLGQHTYDTDCNLFLRVFSGEVDESVRHEQLLLEGEIMRMFKLLDMSINHQATGWLHKADVKTALTGFFKGKKVDRLAEVLEALDTDEPGDALRYSCMFSDDDELNQGLTAEIIRSQHLTEQLEFLQEMEDAIRDAAEDNGTTSLTPVMLATCLHKAHKSLDSEAVSEYVTRAFGPAWQQHQHRIAQPLGAIIRAVRCGGLPNMVRPAGGPSTVAGAVNRIVPVGKFKTKLVSALKVGFSKDSAAGGSGASGGNAARRGSMSLFKSRRATQEAVSAAVAAVLSGHGSKPRSAVQPPIAAAAAAAEGPSSSSDGEQAAPEAQTASSSADGAASAVVDATIPAQALPAAADTTLQGPEVPDAATGSGQSAGEHTSEQATGGQSAPASSNTAQPAAEGASSGSSSRPMIDFAAGLQILVPDNDEPPGVPPTAAAAADGTSAAAPAAAATPSSFVPPTPYAAAAAAAGLVATPSAAAGVRSSALARALTVDVLSAMEAVRQSWLKEEGDKLISFSCSGSLPARASGTATAAAGSGATAAAALPASRLSMPQLSTGTSPASFVFGATESPVGLLQGELLSPRAAASAAAARPSIEATAQASLAGSRRFSAGAVPSLRLLEVLQAGSTGLVAEAPDAALVSSSRGSEGSLASSTYRSSTGSTPGTGCGSTYSASSCGTSSTGGADSSRGYQQQHSLKSILHSTPEAHKPATAKHVQISTADTVFAFCADHKDDTAGEQSNGGGAAHAAAVGPGSAQLQQQQPHGISSAAGPATTTTACALAHGDAGQGSPAAASAAVSRSSSTNRKRPSQLSMVPSTALQQAAAGSPRTQAQQRPSKPPADAAGPAEPPVPKRRGSKSAKHAALLPQLLLTDADDACAAQLATPSGAGEHAEVCFTPQAPEEGGKRNAILMRRLNKGKSLQQLEEVMLAVAVGEVQVD